GISANSFFTRWLERAIRSAPILASSSLKFLAIALPPLFLFPQLPQVLPVNFVRQRNHVLVPADITRLVAADQKQAHARGIKNQQDPVGPSGVLNPQFFQVVAGTVDAIGVRPPKTRPALAQKLHDVTNRILFVGGQMVPPRAELISEFDLPFH